MKRVILNVKQAEILQEMYSANFFSMDTIRSRDWKDGNEIIRYCESCNLYRLGDGLSRVVFQVDDDSVIKIQKSCTTNSKQNAKEVYSYEHCDSDVKEFMPRIFEYDRKNASPLWIISEQVLPATYADFKKILGFDFGSYNSRADEDQMERDMAYYSKYSSARVPKIALNLMNFFEAYMDDGIDYYRYDIEHNEWLNKIYTLLEDGIVSAWELEKIDNWGLVIRNGRPTLILIDIGI